MKFDYDELNEIFLDKNSDQTVQQHSSTFKLKPITLSLAIVRCSHKFKAR